MITVKLFATLKDKAGRSELQVPAESGTTVAGVLLNVSTQFPPLADILASGRIVVSVNQEFVKSDAMVRDGDEVALMPPFSGGDAVSDRIRVQAEPFSVDQEIERLKKVSSAIGGIVTFLGTTRDISKGKSVAKLEFEHYPGMAEKKLAEIRKTALEKFGAIDITIIHRIGLLPVGENIVLIAAAAEHREEAFAAARFCIDELKRITPIWKKETTPEGEYWVEEHP